MADVPDRPVATEFDPRRDWVAIPEAWSYETDRSTLLDTARRQAAGAVEIAVATAFPSIAIRMRAAMFLAYDISAPFADCDLLGTALAVCARDAFIDRAWPPPGRPRKARRRRPETTDPSTTAYLEHCAERAEGKPLADNLLWSTMLATVPANWLPVGPTAARIANSAIDLDGILDVDVLAAQLRGPAVGGAAWAARQTRNCLTAIAKDLAAGRPALVALHRQPLISAGSTVMLAYRYAPTDDGGARLTLYDPLNGAQPVMLGLSFQDGALGVTESPQSDQHPPIRAIRYLEIIPERSPDRPGLLARTLLVWRLRRWFGRNRRPAIPAADGDDATRDKSTG